MNDAHHSTRVATCSGAASRRTRPCSRRFGFGFVDGYETSGDVQSGRSVEVFDEGADTGRGAQRIGFDLRLAGDDRDRPACRDARFAFQHRPDMTGDGRSARSDGCGSAVELGDTETPDFFLVGRLKRSTSAQPWRAALAAARATASRKNSSARIWIRFGVHLRRLRPEMAAAQRCRSVITASIRPMHRLQRSTRPIPETPLPSWSSAWRR